MRYYAIRRKSDGAFLPAGRARGFTHDKPVSLTTRPPRLFIRERDAKAALRCWLGGEWVLVSSARCDEDGEWDSWHEPPAIAPLDRKADDMEVIPVEVGVVAPKRDKRFRRAHDGMGPRDVALLGGDPSL